MARIPVTLLFGHPHSCPYCSCPPVAGEGSCVEVVAELDLDSLYDRMAADVAAAITKIEIPEMPWPVR